MRNLAQLLVARRESAADRRFGLVGDAGTFADHFDLAARLSSLIEELGVAPGQRVAVVGHNSLAYLQTWMALQLVGAEPALVNPTYPPELLTEMFEDLDPAGVVWVDKEPLPGVGDDLLQLDTTELATGGTVVSGRAHPLPDRPPDGFPGLDRDQAALAGFMHTSGTTGVPKFCAQSHEYFLRLGRFIADSLMLCARDVVYAPLPLFHINPLGYGVIGGLTAGAGVLSTARFSASRFWDEVRDNDVTSLILHAPPVEILKRSGESSDAAGHRVRSVFYADADFMAEFDIPLGISAYGSTEAGGLCHVWVWRNGDRPDLQEGMSRYGGRSRHEVEWRVLPDGEIEVRADRDHVLFEGYVRKGELVRPFDDEGWFATGDLGRVDDAGQLVFIERRAESIRVKGEFVPIGFVEDHFSRSLPTVRDLAIWRYESSLVDDEIALYLETDALDQDLVEQASESLPPFMRPRLVVRVDRIPRDAGVGKIRRRELADVSEIERLVLR